jgi:membrane fusion protein (multidrug efflux system)
MFLMFLIIFIVQGCSKNTDETKSMEQIYAEKGVPVRTETLETTPLSSSYSTSAVLTGIQESTAHASIADRVDQILYRVGERVKKDDIVLTFPTDNPAAQYMQAEINVEHMRTTLARIKSLYESGGISRQEYDNVAAQCQVAEANWDAAQQAVKVRAPISGVLTRVDVQESDNVDPGDALFTVARTDELKAQLWVSENRIGDIHKGDKARVIWNGIELIGHVSQVDISLNSNMQAFGVQVVFTNTNQLMQSGVNADIRILSVENRSIITTARKNLIKEGDEYYAYKVIDGKAVKQPVILGRQIDLDVEIIRGLNAGDTIITEGLSLLEDGQRIHILD